MTKHRTLLTVLGFLIGGLGFLSLVLSLVGVELGVLAWLRALPPLLAFLLRIGFILAGFVLIYVGATDWDQEEA